MENAKIDTANPHGPDVNDIYVPWCKYNVVILCPDKDRCANCGWNPEVEEKRKMAIWREMNRR